MLIQHHSRLDIPMGYPSSKGSSMTRRLGGYSIFVLAMLGVTLVCEGSFGFVRKLCELDVYFTHEGEGLYGTWSELYKSSSIDYYSRATLAKTPVVPNNNLAFVISMLECPDLAHQGVKEDQPVNELFYDSVSLLKYALCADCIDMAINGIAYTTSILALVPGDAIECMGANGEPFDRVKVLEELRIGVHILGSPVDRDDLTSDYLRDNVDNDVGIKDLIKLRAFNMTQQSVVILVDQSTYIMQDLEPTIETFINSPAKVAYAEDYTPQGLTPSENTNGVNTGFVLIKPDEQEFDAIVNTYKTSEYDPNTGWGNSGIGGFPGAMGTAGILKYHYSQNSEKEKTTILSKCIYNNDAEPHLDGNGVCRDGSKQCPSCASTPETEIVIAKLNDKVCGKPFDCPDKGLPDGHLCDKIHKKWFESRVKYEDKHFKGGRRAQRNGNFKKDKTLGFCTAPGPSGYQKILPDADSGPLPIPEPAAQTNEGCQNTCNAGEYLKADCQCTSDACDACPEGTRCQPEGNGVPALCIDCGCGFCDKGGNACCDFNGVNNCKSATNKKECLLQNGFYPGWPGAGNSCAGVEISATAVPNGCGCKPNDLTPCTYDPTPDPDDKCFIVTAHEILTTSGAAYVEGCKSCLDSCDQCVSGSGQGDVDDMMKCIGKSIGKKGAGEICRANCASECKR